MYSKAPTLAGLSPLPWDGLLPLCLASLAALGVRTRGSRAYPELGRMHLLISGFFC